MFLYFSDGLKFSLKQLEHNSDNKIITEFQLEDVLLEVSINYSYRIN